MCLNCVYIYCRVDIYCRECAAIAWRGEMLATSAAALRAMNACTLILLGAVAVLGTGAATVAPVSLDHAEAGHASGTSGRHGVQDASGGGSKPAKASTQCAVTQRCSLLARGQMRRL